MGIRKNISSGAKWESIVGYSRAVVVDNRIEIAGTTASEGGKVLYPNDVGAQTNYILELFSTILKENGFGIDDVVRTRMYVTNINDWKEIGEVHGSFFKDVRPASTMVEVSAFVDPAMLVEIEAVAIRS